MPKVLLIQPSQYGANSRPIKQSRLYLPGLVFPLLAALTPKNWSVEVRMEVLENIPLDTHADIVGIGAMGHALFRAFDISDEFRRRGKKVFLGGYMASLVPDLAREHADSIIIGDAEIAYPKLLDDFEHTGIIEPLYNYPLNDLAGLPVPRYEVLTEKRIGFMLPVQAGRGCHFSCSFCSIACIYRGKYLVRPVDEVIRDIKRIRELGFKRFYLIDDNIVSNPGYLGELCQKIRPLKMKWATQCSMNLAKDPGLLELVASSGCSILSLGLESISQEGLEMLNKGWLRTDEHEQLLLNFRKAGIMVSAEMIIGTDSDTEDSLGATLDFIMRTRLPLLRIYILTPVPGTDFYSEMKQQGRLIHENYKLYDAYNVVHHPKKITAQKLAEKYAWLNRKLFSLRNISLRTLLNPEFRRYPAEYLFAFGVNLHYRSYVRRGDLPIIV